ncbi:MAG: class I adenylate-forming enzyme family protein [Smithellaceae bacterium]|nr:class I adenylate-forming enzyme family protein [Smithellaceae bacterium]
MARKCFSLLLADMARYNPSGKAITYGDKKVTWREFNNRVNRLSQALMGLGVKKGDHAIILFHDCPEFIEANYALQKIGAVPIPMNFRFVAREIEYQTTQSDSTVFIFEDLFAEQVLKALSGCPKVKRVICARRSWDALPEGMYDYETLVEKNPPVEPPPVTGEDDICTISYTGGTTGMPKGVVLTYKNFWNLAGAMFGDLLGRVAGDPKANFGRIIGALTPVPGMEKIVNTLVAPPKVRSYLSRSIPKLLPKTFGTPMGPILNRITGGFSMFLNMPLFHMANYQVLIIGPMSGLSRYILRPGISFDPQEALEIIEKERPMLAMFVPTQWKKLLDYPELHKYNKKSVLVAMTGAGVNPAQQKKRILKEFPNALVADVFGQTEMTPDTSIRLDASEETLKDHCVGKPLAGVEVRIVSEKGEDVPKGEVGEILYKSGTIMKEYYGDKERTEEVIQGGWFHSGDLGYLDKDGEIIVVDRMKETISTGGEKVYPHEVEEILESHPKVEHACVIGVPDETWGSTVRAILVLYEGTQATQEEIIEWCRDKMTGFKRPKTVVFAEALPLSPVGKVMRAQVKEKYGRP